VKRIRGLASPAESESNEMTAWCRATARAEKALYASLSASMAFRSKPSAAARASVSGPISAPALFSLPSMPSVSAARPEIAGWPFSAMARLRRNSALRPPRLSIGAPPDRRPKLHAETQQLLRRCSEIGNERLRRWRPNSPGSLTTPWAIRLTAMPAAGRRPTGAIASSKNECRMMPLRRHAGVAVLPAEYLLAASPAEAVLCSE
jgi:hypothetical protein